LAWYLVQELGLGIPQSRGLKRDFLATVPSALVLRDKSEFALIQNITSEE
jgi:hypothetical protein